MSNLIEQVQSLTQRIISLEKELQGSDRYARDLISSEIKNRWKMDFQESSIFGLHTAICVSTKDHWKQGRVRYWSPTLHTPDMPIEACPFALPISTVGGFDDCGLVAIPPVGSTLCLIFESGSRTSAYYIGTTWHRNRGPDGQNVFGRPIPEFDELHTGRGANYILGPTDGSACMPPWNTENYGGIDLDSSVDFENIPDAQKNVTYPHITGIKTPQKHMLKMVDGDYKCNQKNKRIEILSGGGNYILLKDDHLHEPSWSHPSCSGFPEQRECSDEDSSCEDTNNVVKQSGNPYVKTKNECRPLQGPGTPQNNKVELPQTGIQLLSYGGHSLLMDDSVEEPSGKSGWERSIKPFDFGCTDKFTGKLKIISATGHKIEMSDVEESTGLRGENNFIRISSATGNRIELNDHTKAGDTVSPGLGGTPKLAGAKRGITMQSSSNHVIQMIDEDNEQTLIERREGNQPQAKAKKAFVRIRSGYGMEILLEDKASQEETQEQRLSIFCPQKDNEERGPHLQLFQEKPDGPGLILVRAGGHYVCSTYDHHYTIVGDKEENPTSKVVVVSKHNVSVTEKFYYNVADVHAFFAKRFILLMAGEKDCPPPPDDPEGECSPCVWPVLCLSPKGVTISDRVFVSASKDAGCASIFQLRPFTKCKPFKGCEESTTV
jgi:hypothetical protein